MGDPQGRSRFGRSSRRNSRHNLWKRIYKCISINCIQRKSTSLRVPTSRNFALSYFCLQQSTRKVKQKSVCDRSCDGYERRHSFCSSNFSVGSRCALSGCGSHSHVCNMFECRHRRCHRLRNSLHWFRHSRVSILATNNHIHRSVKCLRQRNFHASGHGNRKRLLNFGSHQMQIQFQHFW